MLLSFSLFSCIMIGEITDYVWGVWPVEDKTDRSIIERGEQYCSHFTNLFHIYCAVVEHDSRCTRVVSDSDNEVCRLCEKSMHLECNGTKAFVEGCTQAYRWDGMYIYLCPAGLVLINVYLGDRDGKMAGGIVAGPACMGQAEDNLQDVFGEEMIACIERMPSYSPSQIQSMGEMLAAVSGYISGMSHGKSRQYFYRQDQFLNTVYVEKMKRVSDSDYYTYPIALERKLRIAVRGRDKEATQVILNQILAYIYLSNNWKLEAIKPRIVELIIVTSRSAIDAGADMNEIHMLTQKFTEHIQQFTDIEELSAWISGMLQRFIAETFEFGEVKNEEIVYKVVDYLKKNYMRRITLDEIAAEVFISKAYLSSIFKKDTGESIINYLNRMRVEKSKVLLKEQDVPIVEVANLCGFDGQSYFTKVFRELVGVTPMQYRKSRLGMEA